MKASAVTTHFAKLGGTVSHEFERLLVAGPNAMRSAPARILPAVRAALIESNAQDIANRWTITYSINGRGLLSDGAEEATGLGEETMPGRVLALLSLRGLLTSIADMHMPELRHREQVFRELVRLFWLSFDVHAEREKGVSISQTNRRKGTGDTQRRVAHAKRCRAAGHAWPDIVGILVKQHGVTEQQARSDCHAAGRPKRAQRPRSI